MGAFLDSERIFSMGWQPKTNLIEGITKTYQTFIKEFENGNIDIETESKHP